MTRQLSKRPSIANNTGTLYELPIIGAVLMLAGVFLSSGHPGFLALTGLGIIVLFLPSIMGFADRLKSRTEHKRLFEMCAGEFAKRGLSPGLALRGNRSAGMVFIDSSAKQIAVVNPPDAMEIFAIHDLKEIALTRGELVKLGGQKMVRYYMTLAMPGKNFTLAFTSLRRARRLFGEIKKIAGSSVALNDKTIA